MKFNFLKKKIGHDAITLNSVIDQEEGAHNARVLVPHPRAKIPDLRIEGIRNEK